MKTRRFVTVGGIITAVLICALTSGLSYLALTHPIYPNAIASNETGRDCDLTWNLACRRTLTFYTADSADAVKTYLSRSGVSMSQGEKTSLAVVSSTRQSLPFNLFGFDSFILNRVQYLYIHNETGRTRLTQTTHTTIGLQKQPTDDWLSQP